MTNWKQCTRRYTIMLVSALCLISFWPLHAAAMSVLFINPGKANEMFWLTSTQAMQAAAKQLDVQLEVRYLERDHSRQLEIVREIAALPKAKRPNYVICSNDYGAGAELLPILDGAGIKVLFAYSTIENQDEKLITGLPRSRYRNWLGSLIPNSEEAGYFTAKALIAHARRAGKIARGSDGKIHMLAIAGDRSTPTSVLRNQGMQTAVAEASDVRLEQIVFAEWNREQAELKSAWLFQRYPDARLIWSGSDQMAFGAMSSWEKRGGQPGVDAWFSGINTSPEALQDLQSGRLTALSGGHFMAGAWALVMLYDYEHGNDFGDNGYNLQDNMFTLFSINDAKIFDQRFVNSDLAWIPFRQYSKTYNRQLKRYDFNFKQLLH